MAIVEMKKATIIALKSEKPMIMDMLHEFGILHIVNITSEPDFNETSTLQQDQASNALKSIEDDFAEVKYTLEFLERFSKKKKPRVAGKIAVDTIQYANVFENRERLYEIYKACLDVEKEQNEIKNKESILSNRLSFLSPWKGLKEDLAQIEDSKNVSISAGMLPRRYETGFTKALESDVENCQVNRVSVEGEQAYLIIISHKESDTDLSKIQKQYGFNKITFGDIKGRASENIASTQQELLALESLKSALFIKGAALSVHQEYLETLYDVLSVEGDKDAVSNNFMKSKQTFILSAWVPNELVVELEQRLQSVTDHFSLSVTNLKETDISPTLLKNHKYAEPLEFITNQYSVPNSRGVDPNAIMMPFFVIFFGIMVSDVIYGLIIASVSAYILNKVHARDNFKKILGIMILGGVSSSFWGMMFGGWMGGMFNISPVMFSPLTDPFKMIALCIVLGIIQLFVGFGIQAYLNIKRGFVLDAILDQGLWVLFLISMMSLALPLLLPYNQYAALGLALALVLTQGRKKKKLIMKLLTGVLSLYNITGFLGDVLSYLRLFALGLASGVIGTVINSMAFMLSGSFVGNILMVFILVIGHTFNIAINVLGAYVHSSRLQYVEFFSKFYEGEGTAYDPFRIKTKYVTLNSKEQEASK
jgi:V/A-type H+-transporting ATPase subunit I